MELVIIACCISGYTLKLEKLDKVVAALKSASTVEALDEVYMRKT